MKLYKKHDSYYQHCNLYRKVKRLNIKMYISFCTLYVINMFVYDTFRNFSFAHSFGLL